MSLFNLNGIVSLVKDQYATVQTSVLGEVVTNSTTWVAGQTICSVTLPRSGVWQLQIDLFQSSSLFPYIPNVTVEHNGASVFTPSMVIPATTNSQFIQISASAGDTVSYTILRDDVGAAYLGDLVALQVA